MALGPGFSSHHAPRHHRATLILHTRRWSRAPPRGAAGRSVERAAGMRPRGSEQVWGWHLSLPPGSLLTLSPESQGTKLGCRPWAWRAVRRGALCCPRLLFSGLLACDPWAMREAETL